MTKAVDVRYSAQTLRSKGNNMTMAFLLRFQEQCDRAAPGIVCTGTETHTWVRTEHVDSDPGHHDFCLVPSAISVRQTAWPICNSSPSSASPPPTLVSRPDVSGGVAVVRKLNCDPATLAGTQTITEHDQESPDNDPTYHSFDTLPKAPKQ